MSWRNIILPSSLTYLSRLAPNTHFLLADDAFTSGLVCSRVSSTTLLISGANVCFAACKQVTVSLRTFAVTLQLELNVTCSLTYAAMWVMAMNDWVADLQLTTNTVAAAAIYVHLHPSLHWVIDHSRRATVTSHHSTLISTSVCTELRVSSWHSRRWLDWSLCRRLNRLNSLTEPLVLTAFIREILR